MLAPLALQSVPAGHRATSVGESGTRGRHMNLFIDGKTMIRIQRQECHPRQRTRVPGATAAAAILVAVATTFLAPLASVAVAAVPAIQTVPSDTAQVFPLEPVEVSVLRTPVRLDAAPLAVAALGEADLRRGRSGAFLEEALRGLPGVQVANRYNFAVGERLVVRGFGGRAQFGIRGVRVVVDGIPATLPDGQGTLDHLDVGSLGRVEVVRGPASALFGNASGGVLAFQTRAPSSSPLRMEAEYVGGSFGLSRTQVTASGTLNDTGYLVNFSLQDWEGYRDRPGDADGVYGTADRIGLNARMMRSLAGGDVALTLNYLDLDSQNPGQLLRSQVDDQTLVAHGAGPVNNISRAAGKEITQTQLGLTWDGPLGGLDAGFSAYGVQRHTINPIVPAIIDLDRDALGLRFQLSRSEAWGIGTLRWHTGAEAEFMFDDRLNFVNANGERGNLTVNQRERVRSAGLFFQANIPLSVSAEGLVGLRYDRHDFRAWDHVDRPQAELRTGERTMSRISPSVGVNIPIAQEIGLFANVGTVFETPSTTELGNRPALEGGFNPDLDPQTGVSMEIGIRGRINQALAYEFTTYRTNLSNEIVRYQEDTPGLQGRDFFRNAGKSTHTGAEVTLSAASSSGLLRGNLTYTYTNARFDKFVQDGVDVSGNRIPGLAPQRAQGVFRVNPDGFFAEVATTYVDNVPVDDANTPGFSAPAHLITDIRAGAEGVQLANMIFSPWAAVTNVFDEYFVASVIPNAAGASPAARRYYDPGPGRAFQVGIRATWATGN